MIRALLIFLALSCVALTPVELEKVTRIEALRGKERAELSASRQATIRAQLESSKNEGRLEKAEGEIKKVESERDGWHSAHDVERDRRVESEKKELKLKNKVLILYGTIALLVVSFGICVWLRIKGIL